MAFSLYVSKEYMWIFLAVVAGLLLVGWAILKWLKKREKSMLTAFLISVFFGPFVYLYMGRALRFKIYLLLEILLDWTFIGLIVFRLIYIADSAHLIKKERALQAKEE